MHFTNVLSSSNSMLKKRLRVFENISNEGEEEEKKMTINKKSGLHDREINFKNIFKLGVGTQVAGCSSESFSENLLKFSVFSNNSEKSILPLKKFNQPQAKGFFQSFNTPDFHQDDEDDNFSQLSLEHLKELDLIEKDSISSKRSIGVLSEEEEEKNMRALKKNSAEVYNFQPQCEFGFPVINSRYDLIEESSNFNNGSGNTLLISIPSKIMSEQDILSILTFYGEIENVKVSHEENQSL
jgi:hypothetical protein